VANLISCKTECDLLNFRKHRREVEEPVRQEPFLAPEIYLSYGTLVHRKKGVTYINNCTIFSPTQSNSLLLTFIRKATCFSNRHHAASVV
jgi:hypothetical protein